MHTDKYQAVQRHSAETETEKIFNMMDKNHDGRLSMEEFVEGAKTNTILVTLLSR